MSTYTGINVNVQSYRIWLTRLFVISATALQNNEHVQQGNEILLDQTKSVKQVIRKFSHLLHSVLCLTEARITSVVPTMRNTTNQEL